MAKFDSDDKDNEAKFNFGVDTLKRISEILREYKRASIALPRDGEKIKKLYDVLRMLYLASYPLLENGQEVKELLRNVQFTTRKRNGRTEILYIPNDEYAMDDIVEKIEKDLQENGGYFMPTAEDEGL